MVDRYNTFMDGVDKRDLLSYYSFNHRTVKWYKRATFLLIGLTIVKANILYQMSTTEKDISHIHFRIKLATQMVTRASIDLASSASSPRLPPDAFLHEHRFLGKYHLVQVESHHSMNVMSVVIRNKMVERPQHTIINKEK